MAQALAPSASDLNRRAALCGGLAASGLAVAGCKAQARAEPPPPGVARTDPPPALRRLTATPVGVCYNTDYDPDPAYGELIGRQFSQLTPEWNFQMPAVLKPDGRYDWAGADAIASFARQHDQRIHGTSLVWYALTDIPVFQALAGHNTLFARRFHDHIATMCRRYKGVIRSWDVVNEPITDNGSGLREHLWSQNLGGTEEYMVRAFEAAAEADPDAVLLINDYWLERYPKKRWAFMRAADRLRQRGCKLGAIGTQNHLDYETKPGQVTACFKDLASLGLPIHVSEFDVRLGRADETHLSPQQKTDLQVKLAAETLDCFRGLPARQQFAFSVWGARDRDSHLNRPAFKGDGTDAPLLFDDQSRPKPVFWAIADRLAEPARG